jgi:hypothetical protein
MNVDNMDYTNLTKAIADEVANGNVSTDTLKAVVNLLMPEYKRRVEVEDLDKNFWVISQLLSAILSVLFGDDNGLQGILKGQMAETMELWNNVKYLWNVTQM